ncbi:FMN-binding protein [Shewanella amazonensis]|uniref:FMN-binding n=1 Tax=Shewanella amazonensis (strain ATCC BAA-1098 / SB2B) TaxID=326297 RepID=A1S340_SHEAM|nr:FMN-binding protein [Shewanella amazonensis]ABL98796.1 FMN-binding [Shewanella amazonensis SB2B]
MKKYLLTLLACWPLLGHTETSFQSNEGFIADALGAVPKASVLWLDDTQKANIENILAHAYNKLRVRYWRDGAQTVWILDEIGKESPITVGIHIANQQIVKTKVLVYRESRGDEVRHDFFTNQFKSATLTPSLELDRSIDGITGATLSVRALTKLSRIALYLDAAVQKTP